MRSQRIFFEGYTFDSVEEVMFYYWCKEAQRYGYLQQFKCQTETPHIKSVKDDELGSSRRYGSPKGKARNVFSEMKYTADFSLIVKEKFFNDYPYIPINNQLGIIVGPRHDYILGGSPMWVEIKPPRESVIRMKTGDKLFTLNNSLKRDTFIAKRRTIWDHLKIYINEVVPEAWFKHTWVPTVLQYTGWNPWVPRKTSPKRVPRKRRDGRPYWHGYPLFPIHGETEGFTSEF